MLQSGSPISTPKTHLDTQPRLYEAAFAHHGQRPVDCYELPRLWCLHFYHYHAELVINDDLHHLKPGTVTVIPPRTRLEYRYRGPSVHAYAHFSWGRSKPGRLPIPVIQDLGPEFASLEQDFQEVIRSFPFLPLRAEVRFWDILWRLAQWAEQSQIAPSNAPRAIRDACQMIESQLAAAHTVPAIAASVGLSQNHLTRLFREHCGCTVVGYLIGRRMARARHLLEQTTLPIKVIAANVGISDLHLFNKTVRRTFGLSPRRLRGGGAGFAARPGSV